MRAREFMFEATRRGLLRGAAGIAAASALPGKEIAGMVRDLGGARNVDVLARMVSVVPDIEAVVDMTHRFPVDVDMNDITYVLGRDRVGKGLLDRLHDEWEKATAHLPPVVDHRDILDQRLHPDDDIDAYLEKERAAHDEAEETNQRNRGARRGIHRDPNAYAEWRIAREVAEDLGYTPEEIDRIYASDDRKADRDAIILRWDVLARGADRLAGRRTDLSRLAGVLHDAGMGSREWATGNRDMWKVLQDINAGDAHELPAHWPRMADLPAEIKARARRTAPASPTAPSGFSPGGIVGLLRTVASMLRRGDGDGPVAPAKDLGVRLAGKPDDQARPEERPAALPAPGVDLGDPLSRTADPDPVARNTTRRS